MQIFPLWWKPFLRFIVFSLFAKIFAVKRRISAKTRAFERIPHFTSRFSWLLFEKFRQILIYSVQNTGETIDIQTKKIYIDICCIVSTKMGIFRFPLKSGCCSDGMVLPQSRQKKFSFLPTGNVGVVCVTVICFCRLKKPFAGGDVKRHHGGFAGGRNAESAKGDTEIG